MATIRLSARAWRAVLTLAAVVFLAWIAVGVIRAGNIAPIAQGPQVTTLQSGAVSGKRIDGKSWSLDYDRAEMSADGTIARIYGIRDGKILRDGKPAFNVKAKRADVNTLGGDFTVSGDVEAREVDGLHARDIKTDEARYVGGTRQLILDHPVTIVSDGTSITVNKATFDFRTGQTHLGRITAVR